MKKYLRISSLTVFFLALISWGVVGHRTIGKIAENHLDDNAKKAVKDLLGDESLAEVSTYADEIRSNPEYKYTAPWHYINLPGGLTFSEFKNRVESIKEDNVYKALLKCEQDIKDPLVSRSQKIFALKFIVHLVGDLHQPMHVSHAEDRGGNSIHVTFGGKEGNLHGLWDTDLLEHEGLGYEEIAIKYEHISKEKIHEWQHDGLIRWLFESYEISGQLYEDARKNPNFEEQYYQGHVKIISLRLQKAGVRLAGLLNNLFEHYIPPPIEEQDVIVRGVSSPVVIDAKESAKHIGEHVIISGKIVTSHMIGSNSMILFNVGADYPNQDLTLMIRGVTMEHFDKAILDGLVGKEVTVDGKLISYNGKPEIEITNPSQIKVAK